MLMSCVTLFSVNNLKLNFKTGKEMKKISSSLSALNEIWMRKIMHAYSNQ